MASKPQKPPHPLLQTNAGYKAARAWLKQHGRVSERPLAETFAKDFDLEWRYDADKKTWLRWVGTHWARDQTLEFIDAVGKFASDFAHAFARLGDISNTEATRLQKYVTASGMERICRGLPSFRARSSLFDADPYLLGTPGGTVDLKTGTLRPAQPEDYITMLTLVTPAEKEDCPRWIQFIEEVTSSDKDTKDADSGKFLQKLAGVSLCGDPFLQWLAFLLGAGRNGKNSYADTLVAISGDYGYSAPFDMFVAQRFTQHSTEIWALKGKRMVIASEVPDGATWNTQRLKNLTGDATATARGMKRDNETFPRTWTITLLGNKRPKLKNVDPAIKARVKIVPFDRDFKAEGLIDPNLKTKLMKEAPGILRWSINGLLAVLKADGKIIEPARVAEDTKDYLNKYDLQQQFVARYVEKADNAETPVHDFYLAWQAFAEAKDIDPLNERSMSVWLVKLTKAERGRMRIERDGEMKENIASLKGFKVKSLF